ncbi:serine hydrolase [Candidatus Saccharibacteria bacterium]|nr:MAG: serine hydrolase [Candidatus Saccharibacteria bacterium]
MKRTQRSQRGKGAAIVRRLSFVRNRKFWQWTGAVLGVVIALQLIFPYDRAFFGASVDGQSVALKTEQEITQLVGERYLSAIVVTVQPDTRTSFADVGVRVDSPTTARQVVAYPVWQRLIPFSSLTRGLSGETSSQVKYAGLSVEQWAADIEKKCALAAKDASVAIQDGKLAVVPSAKGAQCSRQDVIRSLKSTPLSPEMKVSTARKVIEPKRSDAAVAAQIKKIEAVIADGLDVDVSGTIVSADSAEIVTWLTFSETKAQDNSEAKTDDKTDGDDNQLKLDVDPGKLQDFIARVQRPVYVAPGTTVVSMRDGIETGRVSGAAGRGVDTNDLIAQLREQLNQSDEMKLTAKVAALAPKVTYQRTYTNSTAGLQALINDIASEKGNMAIAITELDGQRRNVSANGDKQYHPASTYKLFVAYGVIKRVEANQWKWSDQINGMSVDDCLIRMIVNSDNACAEAFAEKIGGWSAVQIDVRATGATGTNLNLAEPVGTVKDQVLFLQKLQDNQLMKQEHRDKLLGLMKRQQYRAGIPAGVASEVADKVGFLGANLHDSGLIYTSHGVYALSIYSSGGSWSNIADAARRIEALLAS